MEVVKGGENEVGTVDMEPKSRDILMEWHLCFRVGEVSLPYVFQVGRFPLQFAECLRPRVFGY